eukprot:s1459_g9.t1
MQAQIVNKMPEDKTEELNAFNKCCAQMSVLLEKVHSVKLKCIESDMTSDISGLYNSMACVQGLEVNMPDNLQKMCEQLKLYAACLEDDQKRNIYVQLSDLALVGILKELCATVDAMQLVDPSTLDFGDVGDGLCGKLASYSTLASINEPDLVKVSGSLADKLKEIKAITTISSEKLETLASMLDTAQSKYSLTLTLLAIMAIVKLLSCKRFVRALKDGEQPPVSFVNQLGTTMKIAREQNLQIPGSLQAKVLKFAPSDSNSAGKV